MTGTPIADSAARLLGYLIGHERRWGERQFMVVTTFTGTTLIDDPNEEPIDPVDLDELYRAGLVQLDPPHPSGSLTGYVTQTGKQFFQETFERAAARIAAAEALERTPPTVFISYSRKDKRWMELLSGHLSVLEAEGLLDTWSDQRIATGSDWFDEIEAAMARARAAVMLVSPDFLSSQFVRSVEVPRLLERRAKEGLRMFPILVRPCPWDKVPWLSRMQMRLADRALTGLKPYQRDTQLSALTNEIHDALLSAGQSTQLDSQPAISGGTLVITKQIVDSHGSVLDVTGADLSGFRFRVDGPNRFTEIVAAGPKGIAGITRLVPGNYSVTELPLPPFMLHAAAVDGVPVVNGQAFPIQEDQTRNVIIQNKLNSN